MDDKARDSQPKLSPTTKFPVADKGRDSQTKLKPTQKFPLATNLEQSAGFSTKPNTNSQISCGIQTAKFSTKTAKFPVADNAWDQTKFSPTTKFSLADKAFVGQFGSWPSFE